MKIIKVDDIHAIKGKDRLRDDILIAIKQGVIPTTEINNDEK